MGRFYDKSAFCRVKVMKVFSKLIDANLVPRHLYMELFEKVMERLKDVTVAVRRQALRIFQELVKVYAYIFNVMEADAKFPSKEEIVRDHGLAK